MAFSRFCSWRRKRDLSFSLERLRLRVQRHRPWACSQWSQLVVSSEAVLGYNWRQLQAPPAGTEDRAITPFRLLAVVPVVILRRHASPRSPLFSPLPSAHAPMS